MERGEDESIHESSTRQSGVELLRILAICGVILLHYNDGKAFEWVERYSANYYVLMLVESVCICAVDLFMVISGYFLSQTQNRRVIKPLELIIEVVLIQVLFCILSSVKNHQIVLKSLLGAMIPANYFVTLYIVVFILSPWINLLLDSLDDRHFKCFILTLVVLFSVCPTIADLLEEVVGKEIMGINTVGAWGAQQGFTAVNFMLCYIIGAYLKHNKKEIEKRYSNKRLLLVYIGVTILIFIWSLICNELTLFRLRSSWEYCNPLVIIQAVLLFVFFNNLTFKSILINRLAKSTFICFLMHGYILSHIGIKIFVHKPVVIMLLHMLLVSSGIYVLCWIFWYLYDICTRKVVRRLGDWFDKKGIGFSVIIEKTNR